MEITQQTIGKNVRTPNGIGTVVGRLIEFGAVTKVLVDHAWLVRDRPQTVFAYPVNCVDAIEEQQEGL